MTSNFPPVEECYRNYRKSMTNTNYPTQLYQSSKFRRKKQLDALKRQVDRGSLIKRLEGQRKIKMSDCPVNCPECEIELKNWNGAIDRCIQITKDTK